MNRDSLSSDFGSGLNSDNLDSVPFYLNDENVCGEGATCHVYRKHLNGMQVAVKRLKSEFTSNPTYVAAYRKEFQIGQRLKHDALPTYREFKEDSLGIYIVMDYVDGISLEDFIHISEGQEYFRSWDNVRSFFKQLLSVVGYLHRCGVIHCDIKPANIMLRHIDLGVMLLDLDKAYSDVLDTSHGGTVSVSAPLSYGEKPTAQKDFVAVGKVMDCIAAAVTGFPRLRFRKFRNDCLSGTASIDSLTHKLQGSSGKWLWRIAVVVFMSVAGILIVSKMNDGKTSLDIKRVTPADTIASDSPVIKSPHEAIQRSDIGSIAYISPDKAHNDNDSFVPKSEIALEHEIEVPATSVPPINLESPTSIKLPVGVDPTTKDDDSKRMFRMPTEEESRKNVSQELLAMQIDMDVEMADAIEEMRKTIEALDDPNINYQKCKKLVSEASKKEVAAFHRTIDKCCGMYPEIDKSDIETEMIRRLDYSQASKLFQQMHKELRKRDKSE